MGGLTVARLTLSVRWREVWFAPVVVFLELWRGVFLCAAAVGRFVFEEDDVIEDPRRGKT